MVQKTAKKKPAQSNTPAVNPAEVAPVQLTVADLQLISRVIDLASRRGAFQAGELSQVGDVYNKLTNFLVQVAPQEPIEDSAPPQEVI